MRKKKKLDICDRMTIQSSIANKDGIEKIAARIGCSKTTVYREIERNSRSVNGFPMACRKAMFGLICNGCCKRAYCGLAKRYYDFKYADDVTMNRRRASRCAPKIAAGDIAAIDDIVHDGVSKGQSLHHIYVSNKPLKAICCERTIRRLCYRGNLSVKPHELRRYVRFRHADKPSDPGQCPTRDIRALLGRTYKDYKKKVASNKRLNVVQFDSVIGKIGDAMAILTITFPRYNFQFGRLIRKGDPRSAVAAIRKIFLAIGREAVIDAFPIDLADNGSEFALFVAIELDANGEKLCSAYFTNPYKATDKSECERCHEFVRYCIPKGKSLDGLTQGMLDEMFSNIDSYARASLGDKTPYEMVLRRFGKAFLDAIGIRRVDKKKVRLTQIV